MENEIRTRDGRFPFTACSYPVLLKSGFKKESVMKRVVSFYEKRFCESIYILTYNPISKRDGISDLFPAFPTLGF